MGRSRHVPIDRSMNALHPVPGCRVERVTSDTLTHVRIVARGLGRGQPCPVCGQVSRSVHSCYYRRPTDLPSLGRVVSIGLRVRRFYCHNAACRRRTFAERLSELVSPFARRTRRLAKAQGETGVALGGEAGARLLSRLSMPTSADTVLRLVRQMPLPDPDPPHVIGVDDWAKSKGRSYGTIIVDLERRSVIDLLPDRTATTLADRLQQRAGIEVVARNRSTDTPGASRLARQPRFRSRIAGICWPICARPSNAGLRACMRVCGDCQPSQILLVRCQVYAADHFHAAPRMSKSA